MAKKHPRKRRMVEIRQPLVAPLEALARRKTTRLPDLVNQVLREMLEREGLWPPRDEAPPAGDQ